MNTLALTLALIFLPGIIWARLDAKYASQTKPSKFDLILNVFVFGLVAYVVTFLLYSIPGVDRIADFNLTALEVDDDRAGDVLDTSIVDDILAATGVSLILGPAWLWLKQHKIITRALQWIGATKRYGDEDVWDFTLNSTDAASRYVNLRDDQTGLTYSGYVDVFSENPSVRELLLRDVIVYDTATKAELAKVPRIYIAREPKGMTLEFPADSTYTWEETPDPAPSEQRTNDG